VDAAAGALGVFAQWLAQAAGAAVAPDT
jgi:hypothetical protein